MKKIILLTVFNLGIIISISASTFEKTFGGINKDSATCVKQTTDGGYIICGSSYSFGAGNYDVYVIKTNASGTRLWAKTFGGSGADYANAIQQTSDGGYIIIGSSTSFNWGDRNIYLIKINSNGALMWSETIGGDGEDDGKYVIQTIDGGYALTGFVSYLGNKTMYFAKLAPDGTGIFEVHLANDSEGNSLMQTANGFVIHGTMDSPMHASDLDVLIKTDNTGNKIWTKVYTGNYSYKAGHFVQTDDGGYMLGGNAKNTSTLVSSAYILKTDSLGNIEWSKVYNAGGGSSFQKTVDNGFIITGSRITAGNKNIHLTKLDVNGCPVWVKVFGGENVDMPAFAVQTGDMGFVLVGNTQSFGAGEGDFYLIKTDGAGSTLCSNNSISINGDVSSFEIYELQMTDDITGSLPEITIASSMGANTLTLSTSICFNSVTSGYMAPDLAAADNMMRGGNNETAERSSDDPNNFFESKAKPNVAFETFNIFPNPNNGSNINMSIKTEEIGKVLVVVYDELGRECYSKLIITDDNSLNTFTIDPQDKLQPGMYMVNMRYGTNIIIKRLIVK